MDVWLAVPKSRWQRLAAIVALLNILVYTLSIGWAWLGSFGIAWTDLLNRTALGDVFLMWFTVSALVLLPYCIWFQFQTRALTLVVLTGLCWSVLWVLDVFWLHQFLAF